jgi:hypothetical protein
VWFKTRSVNAGSGKASECLLLHDLRSADDGKIGVMLPDHIEGRTQMFVLQNDQRLEVRLMALVHDLDKKELIVDPFNLRLEGDGEFFLALYQADCTRTNPIASHLT